MIKSLLAISAVALALAVSAPARADEAMEEANKKVIIDFYDKAINQKDFEAAKVYFGSTYIQHNPMAANGPEGLKAFIAFMKEQLPEYKTEFVRVFADGDYVIVHAHAKPTPDSRGSAVMDIFRLEDGKVVEHWDVIQDVPEKSANENTMF
jgi:predicted SnoaL-like aldol condensation-catalyzing enzyme